MKRIAILFCSALLLAGCGTSEKQLMQRATELCAHVPYYEQYTQDKDFLTDDFYAVLDTMYNLPDYEDVLHEWEFWFVAADGSPVSRCTCEVQKVETPDATHAVALISVQPEDTSYEAEEHRLYMERVKGQWLLSDYDGHKADAMRYIDIKRWKQLWYDMLSHYLVAEIGSQYAQADLCVPVLMIVAQEDCETEIAWVWGEFWVFNYQIAGDTLKTVSGGSHSGLMHVCAGGETADAYWSVCSFEQTEDGAGNEASARRIFGKYYDIYQNIHSHQEIREAARRKQLREYVRRHGLNVRYYQDYGWPAIEL